MRILDLFSGIGGFSLGLERAGTFRTVAFCETDPFCRRVLADHWPEVLILGDITQVSEFPAADVVVGGFPCQDVSRAGRRAGITGERSGLYRELVRAVRLVRPRYAIVENVAALLSDGMGDVLGDLAEGGACVEWDCVPAEAVGAPHERDRVWIVRHSPDAAGIGCGPGRARRPPDSFAWVRDATRRDAPDADSAGLAVGEGIEADAQPQLSAAERAAFVDVWQSRWPCEPALLGMDDGIPDRVDRTRALGNTLVPSIAMVIGAGLLDDAMRGSGE